MFDKSRLKWVPWLDSSDGGSRALDPEAEYSTIIVPTVDTVRYSYLLDKFVTHHMHCLFVGPTGAYVGGRPHSRERHRLTGHLLCVSGASLHRDAGVRMNVRKGRIGGAGGICSPRAGHTKVLTRCTGWCASESRMIQS